MSQWLHQTSKPPVSGANSLHPGIGPVCLALLMYLDLPHLGDPHPPPPATAWETSREVSQGTSQGATGIPAHWGWVTPESAPGQGIHTQTKPATGQQGPCSLQAVLSFLLGDYVGGTPGDRGPSQVTKGDTDASA